MSRFLKPSLDWFLVFVPITAYLEFAKSDNHIAIFACACLAILPLAGWLGHATEHLAARTSEAIGGLLNATFGNAAELIIAFMALQKGLYPVVKASLTGSIIGNLLLVFGLSCLAGGLRFPTVRFNGAAARSQATLLSLTVIALVVPAAFHHLVMGSAQAAARESDVSLEISILLLICYGLSLLFSLRTHKQLFASAAAPDPEEEHADEPWTLQRSLLTLAVATGLIAWMSEVLVGSVEQAAHTLGMTSIFVGVIVVAIIGNAAEHSTAILVAMKNRMDLAFSIAVGSSIQIALFVAPLVVIASRFIGPSHMDLVFTTPEILAIGLSVLITAQISGDGETNWFEGVLALAVYLIFGILFFFLPEHH